VFPEDRTTPPAFSRKTPHAERSVLTGSRDSAGTGWISISTFEVVAVVISVLAVCFITVDGESNWMEGVQLLAVYVILAMAFYFLPPA
jgi:hypothetical protein